MKTQSKTTKKQQKIQKAVGCVENFVTIYQLANRGYKVGITNADRIRIVGANPTMDSITDEQVATLRAAVEKAEAEAAA